MADREHGSGYDNFVRQQNEALAIRVNELSNQLAVAIERGRNRDKRADDIEERLEAQEAKMGVFQKAADRWKGAFIVIVGAGSVVSMFLSWGDAILKILGKR